MPPCCSHACCSPTRSEEHTSELQSRVDLVCRLLLEKKKHRRRHGPCLRLDSAGPPGRLRWSSRDLHALQTFVDRAGVGDEVGGVDGGVEVCSYAAPPGIYTLSLHDALAI